MLAWDKSQYIGTIFKIQSFAMNEICIELLLNITGSCKKRGRHHRTHFDPMMALPFCPNVKIRRFSYAEMPCRSTWKKSYCPYTEKPPQAFSAPILNPNSRTFWSGGKDSVDRTTPPPGSSACRDGHSPCIACYTGVCRSRPGRTPIPDAISCSGS